jgi:uncharacterized protein
LLAGNKRYTLMPFRFSPVASKRMLVVNEVGEYIFLDRETFERFVSYDLDPASDIFLDLKGKHFATDTAVTPVIDMLATKYRTKRDFLKGFTGLHIVVVTLRCNQRCNYCHASSQPTEEQRWDMSPETAINVVHKNMESPCDHIKIEFQGGEPLLNFEVVKTIVREAKRLNRQKNKHLDFVVCTNLTLMDAPTLEYLKKEGVSISSSLDGPREVHDRHRILRTGEGTYDRFMENLRLCRSVLGPEAVSPLMTATKESLSHFREIIDEYARLGFPIIFLRHVNPYGYAQSEAHRESFTYDMEEFVEAYKKALLYIIELNLAGKPLLEGFACILLGRILTPFATGFVDLQSPTGAGINGVVYDYNGDVFPSDEARMLAKMGDRRFYLGNVNRDAYLDIFTSPVLQELIEVSCVETLPGCHSCPLQPYCGADPVRNYAIQGDLVGHRPSSDFCMKHKAIIEFLLELIDQDDPGVMDVIWSWITNRTLAEVRGEIPCAT